MRRQSQAPPGRSPHPERKFSSPPPRACRQAAPAGAQAAQALPPPPHSPPPTPHPVAHLRPGRPSPEQHLDLQIFPRSKIMARRWLRSPRIRNTFMVPRAGGPHPCPRTARGQLLGNFLAGEAAATSPGRALGPALRAPRSPPAPPPPLRQRTLGRAVTWPGRQPCRASQEAPPPEIPPPSRPSAAAPGPPARDLGRAPAPLPPPGAPSSASRVYNSGAWVDGGGRGARQRLA